MTTPDKQLLARLLVETGAVRFGRFTTKSGRSSPYFVNLGAIHHGEQIARLADWYARGIAEQFADEPPNCLFGPAYKAIPLVVATAISASRSLRRSVCYSFNRKEAKTHGEAGTLVGREPQPDDRVLIVDDVVTDGGAKREVVKLLRSRSAARITGLLIAVDRMERGTGTASALAELQAEFGFTTAALITIEEIVHLAPVPEEQRNAVLSHLERYRATG